MSKYTIVEADIEKDRDELLRLLKRNLKGISGERYSWSYLSSPYGPALCWMAREDGSGRCVGSGSLFPRMIYAEGEALRGAVAGDFSVDGEHRAYGPAVGLQRMILASFRGHGLDFIYGVPNRQSELVFRRIGYVELGSYAMYVKVLKTEYKNGQYIPPARITSLCSGIIDFGLKGVSREMRYRRPSNVSIEAPEYFDGRFDMLWTRASGGFGIIGERNSRFLNWRYGESPLHDYRTLALVKDGEVAGYVVFYTEENACHVADVFFADDGATGDALFSEFILYARKEGMGSITIRYLGEGPVLRELKRFGFFRYGAEEARVLIHCGEGSPLPSLLLRKERWHFLEGDLDI